MCSMRLPIPVAAITSRYEHDLRPRHDRPSPSTRNRGRALRQNHHHPTGRRSTPTQPPFAVPSNAIGPSPWGGLGRVPCERLASAPPPRDQPHRSSRRVAAYRALRLSGRSATACDPASDTEHREAQLESRRSPVPKAVTRQLHQCPESNTDAASLGGREVEVHGSRSAPRSNSSTNSTDTRSSCLYARDSGLAIKACGAGLTARSPPSPTAGITPALLSDRPGRCLRHARTRTRLGPGRPDRVRELDCTGGPSTEIARQ